MTFGQKAKDFSRGDMVRWLSRGHFHTGKVQVTGHKYVYVTPDDDSQPKTLPLLPIQLQHINSEGLPR